MMVDVTKSNFLEIFPKIEYAINTADFISIDTEFTGLSLDDYCKPSLFDTSRQRYAKLKKSVNNFTLCQIGLTTFKGHVEENRYLAETFNFYLCPVSLGSCDERFTMQASCVKFMVRHSFDFNKWLYEGIPFLNLVQERQIKDELFSGAVFGTGDCHADEDKIQSLCSFVAAWLPTKDAGDCVVMPIEKDESMSTTYLYQADLRKRFPEIWTSLDPFGQVVVKKVTKEERIILELQYQDLDREQREQQLREMLGFTRIFRLLTSLRKPIIGHNMLMDLIFMYDKFHEPLPDSYAQFKRNIHRLFPYMYDTKHISHCLKSRLEHLKLHVSRGLQDLYNTLHSPLVMGTVLLQPSIERVDWPGHHGSEASREHSHQAGYDAFMCGSSFLRICHLLHFRNVKSTEVKPCHFQAYRMTMMSFCNCVNVIRALVSHVKIDGEEPPSQRPPLIHVAAVQPGDRLAAQQLAAWFSMYGTIDIQMLNDRQAIVVTSNYMAARDIIYQFKDHRSIKVSKYKFWEHSTIGKYTVMGSLAVATGTCILLLMNVFKN